MNLLQLFQVILGVGVLSVLVLSLRGVYAQRRREHRDIERIRHAREQGLDVPASLHPVIDYSRCSGCFTCLDVCPEGDLFGVRDGKAVMVEPSRCIGHGTCAEACPTDAITLLFGTAERGVDLPETSEHFETSRAGVHIVGELGGVGLLKNALKQGLEVARGLEHDLEEDGGATDKDVAIVGAGPAGIATALGCRARGISFRIVDQASTGGAVAAYPRQKVAMMEPVKLPLVGTFGRRTITKSQLMAGFQQIVERGKIQVHEGVKAHDVKGDLGKFTVVTSSGAFTAKRVVIAIGKRGTPRKLGVPGEELTKVTYQLVDAQQYRGKRVLVVGGGDSALEAAIALAQEPHTRVTLSYRGDALNRARAANRQQVELLAKSGKIKLLLKSVVAEIRPREVILEKNGQKKKFANDFVIINAGGTLPTEFLKKIKVNVRKYHGEAPSDPAGTEFGLKQPTVIALYALGMAAAFLLTWYGHEYYLMGREAQSHSAFHAALRSSGLIGHGVGILATLLMFSNFLFSGRKRRNWFASTSLRSWMSIHVWAGIVGPILVAYHAVFQSNHLVATATTVAMIVVVLTGLVGRFFYRLLPLQDGRMIQAGKLKEVQKTLNLQLNLMAAGANNVHATRAHVLHAASRVPAKGGVTQVLAQLPRGFFQRRKILRRLRKEFDDPARFAEFREYFERLDRVRLQLIFHRPLQAFMNSWRLVHVSLALMLALLVVVHIAVSLYMGSWWIVF